MALSGEQRVLLGFKDAALEPDTASSWDVSKIGGLPDPPPQVTLCFPACPLCSGSLCHVVQVYCPLEGSHFHRVIHVFACRRKSCWGKPESWVALRSQSLEGHKPQITEASSQQENKMATTEWCDDADNWGMDDNDAESLIMAPAVSHSTSCPAEIPTTDWTSQLQNLSLTDASETVQSSDSGDIFRCYYIAVVDEKECEWDTDLDHARRLLQEYERREASSVEELESCELKGQGEKYEKSDLKSRDLMFYKFLRKIAPCQQQILRYSCNGQPLCISPLDATSQPPPCPRCGSRRIFEFQLMPALVTMLQGAKSDLLLEFGTVLIFTCERSCWEASDRTPVQEFCIVQEDPDQKYFK
ncbi:PREDICTED: programmed cell death protein 2-like isoform X2 [Nanorana parkeri]|uniref:programmed cell death protein 2-like isoform X2 n=1 Tax=Nanorana parkeri TaxID=125878 RepID=UPI000854AE6F|nr:PREDICTED: programmed cell death protein 2-like isoform X2 [Nanorana parkeri]